jgi:hypothetical protein
MAMQDRAALLVIHSKVYGATNIKFARGLATFGLPAIHRDIHEGEEVDESAFKALVRQAVALNSSGNEESEVLSDSAPEGLGTD